MNRLNVEHRTSNFERPILMALRSIYFKTSDSQNNPPADKISQGRSARAAQAPAPLVAQYFFKL